jgi:hypothetical protein
MAAPSAAAIMTKPTESPAPAREPSGPRWHPAAIRLAAVALAFAGWLGYLAYLVVTMPKTGAGEPLILSRSQFLVSELDVIAQVDGTGSETEVTIKDVLSPKTDPPVHVGQKVHVTNLSLCRRLPREGEKAEETPRDWTGPGSYLLPLQKMDENTYRVAPTPPSPGYPPTRDKAGPPRIYPATDAARAQYRRIKP